MFGLLDCVWSRHVVVRPGVVCLVRLFCPCFWLCLVVPGLVWCWRPLRFCCGFDRLCSAPSGLCSVFVRLLVGPVWLCMVVLGVGCARLLVFVFVWFCLVLFVFVLFCIRFRLVRPVPRLVLCLFGCCLLVVWCWLVLVGVGWCWLVLVGVG